MPRHVSLTHVDRIVLTVHGERMREAVLRELRQPLRRSIRQRQHLRHAQIAENPVVRIARAFFLATVAWFVLDTLMSVALGAMINAVLNCLLLGLLLPPLAVLSSRKG